MMSYDLLEAGKYSNVGIAFDNIAYANFFRNLIIDSQDKYDNLSIYTVSMDGQKMYCADVIMVGIKNLIDLLIY